MLDGALTSTRRKIRASIRSVLVVIVVVAVDITDVVVVLVIDNDMVECFVILRFQ